MRIAMGVEYDGTGFAGWQYQNHARSVQDCVQNALSRVANHAVEVTCAGRTDAGVHAGGQVIHFDTEVVRHMRSWVLGANANLPVDVNICWAKPVDGRFHARFSATARTYRYVILNRWVRSALMRHRATWVHYPLDEARMQAAAEYLLGEHDFSAYRAIACQAKSPRRHVRQLTVVREEDRVVISVTANAFLHHMVRNIAGVLIAIGKREREPVWAKQVLDMRDRTLAGVTAPPQGLCLTAVEYPLEFAIPAAGEWERG